MSDNRTTLIDNKRNNFIAISLSVKVRPLNNNLTTNGAKENKTIADGIATTKVSRILFLVFFRFSQSEKLDATDGIATVLKEMGLNYDVKNLFLPTLTFDARIGGFLIPLALSIYLLISCGWSSDLTRTVIGTILVAGLIYALEWILPADPEDVLIDNMFVYGVVAGVVAYVLGRSRRNAFVSCLFGVVLAQLVQWIINMVSGAPSILGLGVGGAFGVYVVAIVISVAVSEFLGRCFESASKDNKDKVFNFETHTYDSEKNGKISEKSGVKTSVINEGKNRKILLKTAKNTQNKTNNTENLQKMAKENK